MRNMVGLFFMVELNVQYSVRSMQNFSRPNVIVESSFLRRLVTAKLQIFRKNK